MFYHYRLEHLLNGDFFTQDDLMKIENHTRKALEAARMAKEKGEVSLFSMEAI
jgi:hypothetical protein